MEKKKINWKAHIVAGIISLLFGSAIFLLFVFALKKAYVDGAAFATLLLLSSGGFIWISREGVFDFAAYGMKQFGNALFSKKPNEYNDFAGYKIYKKESRENKSKYYLTVLIVGGVFLILTIILFLIYKL